MDLAQQNISCLLTHFRVLLVEIPGKTTLLTPLQDIALQPQNMVVGINIWSTQNIILEMVNKKLLRKQLHSFCVLEMNIFLCVVNAPFS